MDDDEVRKVRQISLPYTPERFKKYAKVQSLLGCGTRVAAIDEVCDIFINLYNRRGTILGLLPPEEAKTMLTVERWQKWMREL